MPERETGREGLSRLPELARTAADAQGPLDQRALGPLRLAELRRHSRVDLLEDARHAREHGRPHRRQRLGDGVGIWAERDRETYPSS